jgi:hypothetical protein
MGSACKSCTLTHEAHRLTRSCTFAMITAEDSVKRVEDVSGRSDVTPWTIQDCFFSIAEFLDIEVCHSIC